MSFIVHSLEPPEGLYLQEVSMASAYLRVSTTEFGIW